MPLRQDRPVRVNDLAAVELWATCPRRSNVSFGVVAALGSIADPQLRLESCAKKSKKGQGIRHKCCALCQC